MRKHLSHRITLFDGRCCVRDDERVLFDVSLIDDLTDSALAKAVEDGDIAPAGLAFLTMLRANPAMALYFAADIVVSGWIDVPDEPPGPPFDPVPDPAGGIALERRPAEAAVWSSGRQATVAP